MEDKKELINETDAATEDGKKVKEFEIDLESLTKMIIDEDKPIVKKKKKAK